MIDLYLKNGLDENNQPLELLVTAGKIVDVSRCFSEVTATEVIDLEKKAIITAGWIDDHTHCCEQLSLYYDDADLIGYQTGVTTVIDAGSTGGANIGTFYQSIKQKITNVYAMINVSQTGILAQDELSDLERLNFKELEKAVNKYATFIVGLKARMSKSVVLGNGIKPLKEAKIFQSALSKKLPLMVHIGSNPPELSAIMAEMTAGDVMTHCFNGKPNGILDEKGKVKNFVLEGYRRGIIFDIGHGTDSFNFDTAEAAKQQGIVPQTLSSDIYHRNRENGPVYNLATCIEKMLTLGFTLPEIIPMITSNPAKSYHLEAKGRLQKNYDADITIFSVSAGQKELIDSNGNKRISKQIVQPKYTIINGKVYQLGEV